MKILGWGGSPRDRFARQVLRTVRAMDRVVSARYDESDFSIEYRLEDDTNSGRIFLENTFRETQEGPADYQAMRIRRLVDAVVRSNPGERSWVQVRDKLRPVLRAGTFGLGAVNGSITYLSRPALPFLIEAVVVDEPTSMAYVTGHQLAEWGVSADEVFATARANLAARAPQLGAAPTEGRGMLRFVDSGDAYFTSMLLVDGFLAGLAATVGGRPVAFVPDRDTLIVAAASDELAPIYELVEDQYRKAPRSISPMGYTVDDHGRVIPFTAPPGSPLAAVVHRAEVVLAAEEYAAQKHALDNAHERDGIDIFVASVLVVERPGAPVTSVTVWPPDVDTLLPQADHVAFPGVESGPGDRPLTVPFVAVAREAALVPEPDYAPPRYRVTGWPSQAALVRLRSQAVAM